MNDKAQICPKCGHYMGMHQWRHVVDRSDTRHGLFIVAFLTALIGWGYFLTYNTVAGLYTLKPNPRWVDGPYGWH